MQLQLCSPPCPLVSSSLFRGASVSMHICFPPFRIAICRRVVNEHVVSELLQVILLLSNLLPQLEELLLLALLDGVVLRGTLAALKGITSRFRFSISVGTTAEVASPQVARARQQVGQDRREGIPDVPLAARSRRSSSIAFGHGADRGGEGSSQRDRDGPCGFCDDSADHCCLFKLPRKVRVSDWRLK